MIGRFGVLLALAPLAIAGCSESQTDSANWVKNSQERTFVEVPKAFKRFKVNPFRINKFDQSAERISGIPRNPSNWEIVFDSSRKPLVDNLDDPRPASMVGRVAVFQLNDDWTQSPNFRD